MSYIERGTVGPASLKEPCPSDACGFPTIRAGHVSIGSTPNAEYAKMRDARRHPYLENERGIPCELLGHPRFLGRTRTDRHGAAIFPHFDADGLCGYEIKNKGFTGFASGGTKGLWSSHAEAGDNRACSARAPLMHCLTRCCPRMSARAARRSASKPSPLQPELIRATVAVMPASSTVIAAMDADADGRKLAEVVHEALRRAGRADLRFEMQEPKGVKDWNDELRAKPRGSVPWRPDVPSVA